MERTYILKNRPNGDASPITAEQVEILVKEQEVQELEIIQGYFNGTNFYTDALYTTLITPDATKLYISKNGNLSYRYEGGYKLINDSKPKLVTNATTSGTYNLDWNSDTWNLTLTGATTLTQSNLPTSGTNTKTISLYVTGNFALTYPSGWTTKMFGTYNGTKLNQIVVEFRSTGNYWVTINN